MAKDLAGKIALVTGSGRGLGSVMARKLAARGADVVVHDLKWDSAAQYGEADNLGAMIKTIEGLGVRSMGVTGNIGDRDAVANMRKEIEEKFGPVEILVNCAGGDIGAAGGKPVPNNILGITYEDLITLTNNNLIGTMLVTQAFVPQMVERQHGIVVNIASVARPCRPQRRRHLCDAQGRRDPLHPLPRRRSPRRGRARQRGEPGPSKTARFQATRTVEPEKMNSNKVSMDRYAEPEEIADAVVFLCSPEAKFIHGQLLRVDGGLQLFAC